MDLKEEDLMFIPVGNGKGIYVEHKPTKIGHLAAVENSLLKNKAFAIGVVRSLVEIHLSGLKDYGCDEERPAFSIRTNDPISAIAQLVPALKKDLKSVGRLAGKCHDGSSFSFRFKR